MGMKIIEHLQNLLCSLNDDSIPVLGRFAWGIFILCVILLISFTNIIIYFIVILTIDTKFMQEILNK